MKREDIQVRAMNEALKHKRCSLAIGTGGGKTLIGLMYLENYYNELLRVLVAAPKLDIFETWKHEIEKNGYDYMGSCIDYTTYISLPDCSLEYDIVVLDEFHNLTGSHRDWLSRYEGRILGLSGTPPKYEHSEKGKLMKDFCPVVFEYNTDKLIGDGILNDYRIVVHPLKLDVNKTLYVQGSGKGWYTSEQKSYDYWTMRVDGAVSKKEQQIMRIMRMKALMGFKTKEVFAKKLFEAIEEKVILFANETAQADRMAKYTYHSDNAMSDINLDSFKSGVITKLGAVQMLTEGVNLPGLRQAVVMHSFSGASPKSRQKLGRLLRLAQGELATLHLMYYIDTVDEEWTNGVLDDLDKTKISYADISYT